MKKLSFGKNTEAHDAAISRYRKTHQKNPILFLRDYWVESQKINAKTLTKSQWGQVMGRIKYLFESCNQNLADAIWAIDNKKFFIL